jgi:hypothetical protein
MQYQKITNNPETKSAINKAVIGIALNVVVFLLQSKIQQQLHVPGLNLSKVTTLFLFVFYFRSVVEKVGREQSEAVQATVQASRIRAPVRLMGIVFAIVVLAALFMHLFFGILHSDFCPHKPNPRPALCDKKEFNDAFSNVDAHTRAMYYLLKTVNFSAGSHQTSESMKLPTSWKAQALKKFNVFQEVDIPIQEENHIFAFHNIIDSFTSWLRWTCTKQVFNFLAKFVSPFFFPDNDVFVMWSSSQEGTDALKFAGGVALENVALNRGSDSPALNVTSDDAIERLATVGLAAHHLRSCDSGICESGADFLIDYTHFSSMPVRVGYEGYGAIAYFSGTMKLVSIYCSHCGGANVSMIVAPGHELWEHAKWVFKVSMLVTCTIKDHLVGTHLMYSNFMSVALQEELPLNHPMRSILYIHTYGSTTVNRAATVSLCVENGLLHRASAFTWPGAALAFKQSFELKSNETSDLREWTDVSGTAGLSEEVRRAAVQCALVEAKRHSWAGLSIW